MEKTPVVASYFDAVSGTAKFNPNAAFQFIGVRAFIMSASTIADLMDDFYLVLGDRFVDARLYMGGRKAGVRTAAALVSAFKLDPKDKRGVERLFRDFYASLGWACLDFQLDYEHLSGRVVATNSFLAQGALAKFTAQGKATAVQGANPQPRCAMLGGYVAGLVSNLFAFDVDVKETQCLAMGQPDCRFEVTPERLYVLKS